jgi:hypothetical protein
MSPDAPAPQAPGPTTPDGVPPADGCATVRRRHVVFMCGFDPRGPFHYHPLFCTEALKQAQVGGYALELSPRHRPSEHIVAWTIHGQFPHPAQAAPAPATTVQTQYEFLRWDDLIRDGHWPRGAIGLLRSMATSLSAMLANGVAWRTLRTSWPIFLGFTAPTAMTLLAGGAMAAVLWKGVPRALTAPHWPGLLTMAIGLPLLAWLWQQGVKLTHMSWLMHSLANLVRVAEGKTPDLEARFDEFAHHLAAKARQEELDELLIVGHCSGSLMVAKVLARALRMLPPPPAGSLHAGPRWSFLTLGSMFPALTFHPAAGRYREELASIALDARVSWIDITAPPDGCCFALVDPTAPCEQAIPEAQRPKLISPRFAKLFTPATYLRVRWDKYRCHFQYLMASELPGDYDFFSIVAGPMTLAQRFAHQPSVRQFGGVSLLKRGLRLK